MPTPDHTAQTQPKTLLVYFSRPGEQYWNGGRKTVEEGNTAIIAEYITELIPVDVYRIEAADPYPVAYEPTVQRNIQERRDDARPEISGSAPGLTGYDTILLGSPVWASQAPLIMSTFVEQAALLAGKNVHPFVTYAVSQFGTVLDDYAGQCPDAAFGEGLAIRGEEARSDASRDQVRAWLTRSGLL